jgi:iron complex outermembrane receptor protein
MKNLMLLFVILVSGSLLAQDNKISGTVTLDKEGKMPNISVLLYPHNSTTLTKAVITDHEGKFNFAAITDGEYIIKASFLGYEEYTSSTFSVTNKNVSLPTITLKEITNQLNEVVIKQEKPMVQVLADKTVFNVENTLNATGTSGFELLRKAPGVVIDNNDNLIVEGKGGVMIYIDGKQSYLTGADLTNFLKTIQASDVESIEIITQPSSKYEAAGNAGIVNIKLKKNKNYGTNGTLSTGLNVGKYATSVNSVSFNNRNKKSNLYGSYSNRFGKSHSFMDLYRLQNGGIFDATTKSTYEVNANNLKLGYDYYINAKNTVGAVVNGNFNNFYNDAFSRTTIRRQANTVNDSILIAKNHTQNTSYNIYSNFNYKFQDTTGVSFNMDLDLGKYKSDRHNYLPNYYYDATETNVLSEVIGAQNTPIEVKIASLKGDYERNALKGKIGLGFKTSLVNTDNVFNQFEYEGSTPVLNESRSNQFEFEENINALYVNYNRTYKKLNFQAGLRVENTQSDGKLFSNQINDNERVKRDYTDFFPSGGITYAANTNNSFGLIYSRRIERPNYQSLNPFEYQMDELSYFKGNPFLKPQYTDNIKFSHTYKYTLTTTLSYSYISDFFAQVTEPVGENRALMTTRNVANQEVLNLGVSYPFKVKNWWSVYISANAYQSKYTPSHPSFTAITQETFSFYGQNTFKLPQDIAMEVSGWYSSPSVWGGTYKTKSLGSLDLAFQKQFLNKKLTARIAFSDILFTSPWKGTTEFTDIVIHGRGGQDSRQVRFNVNYNFGRDEIKKARNRNTGLEEEKNRIGN